MSLRWGDPDVRAGAGVVGFLALLAASAAWWTAGSTTAEALWYTEYESVEGLAVSAPVQLGGYAIGRVASIAPTAGADGALRYRVALRLDDPSVTSGVARPRAGTVAKLVPAPLVGAGSIVLAPGETPGAEIPAGGFIPGEREPPLLDEVRRTVSTLTREVTLTAGALRATLDTATRVTARLSGQTSGILAQADPAVAELRATLAQAQQALASADSAIVVMRGLAPQVGALLDSAQVLAGTTHQALDQAQRELERQSPRIDRIMAQLDTSSVAMTFLMRKFAQRPLRLLMGVDPRTIPPPDSVAKAPEE